MRNARTQQSRRERCECIDVHIKAPSLRPNSTPRQPTFPQQLDIPPTATQRPAVPPTAILKGEGYVAYYGTPPIWDAPDTAPEMWDAPNTAPETWDVPDTPPARSQNANRKRAPRMGRAAYVIYHRDGPWTGSRYADSHTKNGSAANAPLFPLPLQPLCRAAITRCAGTSPADQKLLRMPTDRTPVAPKPASTNPASVRPNSKPIGDT